MPEPLLTIVTINRNHAEGLARTVASFRSLRDDANVQFVFIDGASNDSSLDVAHSFYKPEEILSEPDAGIYDAMNKGLTLARGAYVIWINSGDELIASAWPDIQSILGTSDAEVIAGGIEVILAQSGRKQELFSCPEQLPKYTLHHQSVFIRRTEALSRGGYPTHYQIVGDRALVLRLHLAGTRFLFIPVVVARMESPGASAHNDRRELENFRLDHELRLISTAQYIRGIVRHRLYFDIIIPAWITFKSVAAQLGIRTLPRPALLVRLFGQPNRSSLINRP